MNKERYTEYHDGVAVIKDKDKLSEALQKLAAYEDREKKYKVGDQFLAKMTVDEVDPDEEMSLTYHIMETQTWVTEQQLDEMKYMGNTMNKEKPEN